MYLSELKKGIENSEVIKFKDIEVKGISYNSKTTKEGDIFVCLVGENTDGHEYAKSAAEKGAVALLAQKDTGLDIPHIIVKNTRHSISSLASTFYSKPSKDINLIGVTGTNGKTTVTHLVQRIIEETGKNCALIGTLGYKTSSSSEYKDAKHTTPQAPELQADLRMMADSGIENVVMEVSSHALEQNRVGGCEFKGAIFTNLTQDHLDYHVTMSNYFDAKAILFKGLQKGTFAVINKDDKYGDDFISVVPKEVNVITYGVKKNADVMAKNIDFSIHGATCVFVYDKKEYKVNLKLNGMFSVYNSLAAFSGAIGMGIAPETAIKALEATSSVAGRFEIVNKEPLVIVDYAHTPDGLENVLKAARELTPKNSKLICLFGCGGDRDTTKRPKMGAIAEALADKVVVTSDNPRSENPDLIISDIMAGIKSVDTKKIFVEADRGAAIRFLPSISEKSDVIVIAGKGHEDYQILKDKTIHFDDREEAKKVFSQINV
ncbi:UDP-N-acetylmuramoyl-L-alanyl-D-glutamate--2,6-diaminopimelate ligase [bacterium]|nr:UDP-N-acetylmuramoyl-L-alanyl-D-glutamate--2,6-diaminopimelate ligase [bacterium]